MRKVGAGPRGAQKVLGGVRLLLRVPSGRAVTAASCRGTAAQGGEAFRPLWAPRSLFATEGRSDWVSRAGGVTAGPVSRQSRGIRTPCTAFCCFPSVEHNFNRHSR